MSCKFNSKPLLILYPGIIGGAKHNTRASFISVADGLAAVKEKNKWGVIDETGAYVIAPTYSNAGPAYSDGLLAVRDNKEKWGFIDKEGRTVIPFPFSMKV